MPPVRWKLFLTTVVICMVRISIAQIDNTITISSDGWRPIIGTNHLSPPVINNQILHYRNQNGESIKAETTPVITTIKATTTTTPPPPMTTTTVKPIFYRQKSPNWATVHHPSSHGVQRPQTLKKYPPGTVQMNINVKRPFNKPVRQQQGNREEIFIGSHSLNGYTTIFKPNLNNIKTRETIGLALPGTNHYSINQQHSHVDFINRFPHNDYQQQQQQQQRYNPTPGFVLPKSPQTNDVNYQFKDQNDEYTRNLVPPPPILKQINKSPQDIDKSQLQLPVPPRSSIDFYQQKPIQFQITKEKLNVFQNSIPTNYNGEYVDYDFNGVKKTTIIPPQQQQQTYEVTELVNNWQDLPSFPQRFRKPSPPPPPPPPPPPKIFRNRPPQFDVDLNLPPFLPTPYRPEVLVPTSPTQGEISTIFNTLSGNLRTTASTITTTTTTPNPSFFNVKEVSTHYPILGKPNFAFETTTNKDDIPDDFTTIRATIDEIITTPKPMRPLRRRRPTRRRPTTTTTTTTTQQPYSYEMESYELQKAQEESYEETERPPPIRRPSRYRTTTTTQSSIDDSLLKSTKRIKYRIQQTNGNNEVVEPVRGRIRPNRYETTTKIMPNESDESVQQVTEATNYETETDKYETIQQSVIDENIEIEEIPTTTVAEPTTTTTTTTTTTEPPTTTTPTKLHRIRTRPMRYNISNRPRFSVKDYKQKYSATTPATITENPRVRNRIRISSTTSSNNEKDETSTETIRRFTPTEPRYRSSTHEPIITDTNIRSVNTRLRPFERYRNTTTTTTTTTPTPTKISIRPNLFQRRRPPPISLRMKIYNKYNKNDTDDKTTTTTTTTTTIEPTIQDTIDYNENLTSDEITEIPITTTMTVIDKVDDDNYGETTREVLKTDFDYSQRVSDLTSSAKNDYGVFKNLQPTNSRRIPNFFTLATDDPILPIEAFFPNLKETPKN